MFENVKQSLREFENQDEIDAISTFLREKTWEDFYDEGEIPEWVKEWSKHWKAYFLWGMDIGDINATGFLIRDELTGDGFFSDLNHERCSGFEEFTEIGSELTVDSVCNQTLKYWDDILGDSVLFGNLRLGELKWLPRERVKLFIESMMEKHGLDRMGTLTIDEWIHREYGKSKKTR